MRPCSPHGPPLLLCRLPHCCNRRQCGVWRRGGTGEGITKVGNSIYMLTWRERTGLVYDLDTFELQRTFTFSTTRNEGWGIVYDGEHLLVTDGSANVHVWDPDTFEEVRRITVRRAGRPVNALNELELVRGELWANIWCVPLHHRPAPQPTLQCDTTVALSCLRVTCRYSNKIARINPSTGDVIGFVDYERLNPPSARRRGEDVFNGIAWNNATQSMCVQLLRAPVRQCCAAALVWLAPSGGDLLLCGGRARYLTGKKWHHLCVEHPPPRCRGRAPGTSQRADFAFCFACAGTGSVWWQV